MMLPSRKTLRTYIGKSTGDVGITEPVRQRLKMERENLFENERRISLEVDEMAIGPKSTLVKQWDRMAGEEHSGGILKNKKKALLANRLLGFLMTGLSTSYKIPVAFFFG
jgi:hypothetical protein